MRKNPFLVFLLLPPSLVHLIWRLKYPYNYLGQSCPVGWKQNTPNGKGKHKQEVKKKWNLTFFYR